MLGERELYEQLKEYYDILGIDENADEIKLKKAYRFAAKKYHPDGNPNNKEAEEKFKKVSEAYTILSDENNRKIYSKLKERYGKNEKTTKKESQSTSSQKTSQEHTNRYIFQRRDGSKIELIPTDKYTIEGQAIYKYRVQQYYQDVTIVDDIYGRINLAELLRNVEYCEFCVNNLLSRENIYQSQIHYNGYVGYVEAAHKNGRTFYRITDIESMQNFDISIDVGDIRYKNERSINIDEDEYNIWIEEIGKIIVKGKPLTQYITFSDTLDIMSIIYSEEIDFNKLKRNTKYYNAVTRMLINENRLKQKIKDGGYVGQVLYNFELDDYDVVVDSEVEKKINTKSKKSER